jgi:hypothetical protein
MPTKQAYRNDRHGIAFDYPPDWRVVRENAEKTAVEISKTGGEDNVTVTFLSLTQMDSTVLSGSEAEVTDLVNGMIAIGASTIVEEMGPRAVGGQDGAAVLISVEKSPRFEGKSFWIMGAGQTLEDRLRVHILGRSDG